MDSAKYRNLSQYLKLERNEAGVGAGYFQCMKFSLLSVGFFVGGRGGGGVGHDFSFLAITACSSLALLDFFGENYHPTSGYF